MRPRVYLSGPITKGDRTHNFASACQAHKKLLALGAAVLNPMLTMLHPDAWTIPHEVWLESDLPWVEAADAVFRIPGESVGADLECEHAKKCGIEVFDDYGAIGAWIEARRVI